MVGRSAGFEVLNMINFKPASHPTCCALYPITRWFVSMIIFFGAASCHATYITPEYFGLHIHRAADGTAWPQVKFGSWRLWDANVQWHQLQPSPSSWNFAKLDLYVALAEINNVAILLPLGLTPAWASARPNENSAYGNGHAAEPASMETWRIYVNTVAKRYKGKIREYQIWNEPNDKGFFSGSTSKLVELTCEAYKILKSIDPAIIVVSPPYTGEQNIVKLEEFLDLGGVQCIDVVAYHLYVAESTPEAMQPVVVKIQQVMKRQKLIGIPLWNTESGWHIENTDGTPYGRVPMGWSLVDSDRSAAFVARAYLLASAFGVDRYYWYSWDHSSLGLYELTAKRLKPGGVALGVVADWMIGNARPVCSAKLNTWSCSIINSSSTRSLVIWSTAGQDTYVVPFGWHIESVVRADGAVVPARAQSTTLQIDGMPQRLLLRR
jgi:hypothetical protein